MGHSPVAHFGEQEPVRASSKQGRHPETGAAAVEFALVVPILLLVVFGIINFGVLFTQQLALNNGVRQGVRLAVVAGNPGNQTCGQVVTGVQSASGPSLAMPIQDIAVQVQRVASTNTSAVALECFGGTNFVTTPSGANVNKRVCASTGSTDNSIAATSQYQTEFLTVMPFLPSPTFTLKATAVYRCEFSS